MVCSSTAVSQDPSGFERQTSGESDRLDPIVILSTVAVLVSTGHVRTFEVSGTPSRHEFAGTPPVCLPMSFGHRK